MHLYPADILLPDFSKTDGRLWATVACDQFTGEPEYWQRVDAEVGDAPSTLRLMLPEAFLSESSERVPKIHAAMRSYLDSGVLVPHRRRAVWLDRTQSNGLVRRGLVAAIDLEEYDFSEGSTSPIRATERTVPERIPPRIGVRRGAPLEMPHVMLLIDDPADSILWRFSERAADAYDFDLMEGGGHITGWLVDGEEAKAFNDRLTAYTANVGKKYEGLKGTPVVFAVGDGNHSLATAKSCYEELKKQNPGVDLSNHPARFALVELENIHDDAQVFEPIHRVITACEPEALLAALQTEACAENGYEVKWYAGEKSGTVHLDPEKSQLAVGVLQGFLDGYLKEHDGEIDYIHDDDALITLAKQDKAIGFLLPAMGKDELFKTVIFDGALPRKTFSMGEAHDKRFYLEARKIK